METDTTKVMIYLDDRYLSVPSHGSIEILRGVT